MFFVERKLVTTMFQSTQVRDFQQFSEWFLRLNSLHFCNKKRCIWSLHCVRLCKRTVSGITNMLFIFRNIYVWTLQNHLSNVISTATEGRNKEVRTLHRGGTKKATIITKTTLWTKKNTLFFEKRRSNI